MCSLAQKIGRCQGLVGEAIVYETEAFYNKHYVPDDDAEPEDNSDSDADEHSGNGDLLPEDLDMDQDQEEDRARLLDEVTDCEEDMTPNVVISQRKRKPQKTLSPMAARDRQFLLRFIVTERCCRIVWNDFFDNSTERRFPYHFVFTGAHSSCRITHTTCRTIRTANAML